MDGMAGGRSTAASIRQLADCDVPVTFACLVPEFDPAPYVTVRELRQYDRAAFLAIAAAADAVADAGLGTLADPDRVGVTVGTGAAGLTSSERVVTDYIGRVSMV